MQAAFRSQIFLPALLLVVLAAPGSAKSQVVTDGSVGPRVSLRGGQIEIGAALGSRRGDNLFHSFEKFGVATGQTATFTGPETIRNVISRVTGGETSLIDGTLSSKVGQADLYFLNPAGVVFGPNAHLDVPGSMHVSTAHELRFADGSRFSAVDQAGSGLTVAAPEAFGFLDRTPGRIAVDQSQLQLQTGKTLSLVGSDIDVTGGPSGRISVQNGTVHLASLDSAGQIKISDATVQAASQGTIHLTNQARIDTSGDGMGIVRIRGGTLLMEDSIIAANNIGEQSSTAGIDVQAGFLEMHNSSITSETRGSGRGGAIAIQAGTLMLDNGTKIESNSYGSGDGGSLTAKAGNLFVLGTGSIGSTSIESNVDAGATGSAGTISISADQVTLRNGGTIRSQTFGDGNTGAISIQAGSLFLSGDGVRSRIVSETFPGSTGTAGPVAITAGTVELHNGGQIFSRTGAQGAAGAVSINTDMLMAFGGGVDLVTGVLSETSAGSTGPAGPVAVAARDIELRGGGQIVSTTRGNGSAGTVTVNAEQLLISRDNALRFTGIAGNAEEGSIGAASVVNVTANNLELRNGGVISSDTLAIGKAGEVNVTADRLLISGNGSSSFTGISSNAKEDSTGHAGTITVTGRDIAVRNGGEIGSNTFAQGNAGTVTVNATDRLLVSGDGASNADGTQRFTGISSNAQGTSGHAGSVMVTGRDIAVRNGGEIASNTFAQGNAGQVSVNATDRLLVSGDESEAFTAISSNATRRSTGGSAGSVFVKAADLTVYNGGQISSETYGAGNAGTVIVQADRLMVDDAGSSQFTGISSNAKEDSTGHAGTITVTGRDIAVRNGGEIASNTFAQGDAGTVTVNATDHLLVSSDGARNTNGTLRFTGIGSSAEFGSSGAGGAVTIQGKNIVLQDHGAVTTASEGTGPGGPISISATDTLRLDHGEIRTRSTTAGGGNLTLAVGRLFDLRQSAVTTSVAGGGGTGGNIVIDHPRFMILNDSRIEANAFGGSGGNITIQADQLIRTPDSVIEASSVESVAGTISITAPNIDISSSLVMLPKTFLDASSLLRESCARQGGRPTSSLVMGGRGGLPPDPDARLSASPLDSSNERRADQVPPSSMAMAPLPSLTKGTLIAGNPVLGAPRISCRS